MPKKEHPFERYGQWTNLDELNDFSARPLRKCMRVNTLKMTVEEFKNYAKNQQWQLEPVPWCREAFYIDRDDRSKPLGKDLLHLLGVTYLQEAASMLPVALLEPKPGEDILDMSAAPGSKTTQTAALMQGRGVIVANDVQEKRIWTLSGALQRSGATNVILTKKVGQWFAKHMTERFDRVLCDAPCTAQGTLRKDSDALRYASLENIEKMARLQYQLLESAVHATKPDGRIVYSTCTLTPEENEQVVRAILEKFPDQLEIIDPVNIEPSLAPAVEHAKQVQGDGGVPMARLWPQTFDTEGFFAAVLHKKASTKDPVPLDMIPFEEQKLPKSKQKDVCTFLERMYGTTFLCDNEVLYLRGDQILLSTKDVSYMELPVRDFSLGLPFVKLLKDGRVRISHELITLRGHEATKETVSLTIDQLNTLLSGSDLECNPELRGDLILLYGGRGVGKSLAKEGKLKNNLPRQLIGVHS